MTNNEFADKLQSLCSENQQISYSNDKVTLITYEERHVEIYNGWMLDEETRRMTCSELMTLEEEYETRKQWAEHRYCGTFLIMDSEKFVESNGSEPDSLVGDVNFVQYADYVELLIMIGDKLFRKRGLAMEAVCLMISHIGNFINERVIQTSVCKDNFACIGLLKKLGFEQREITTDDIIFILPNEKRLSIEKKVNDAIIYKNDNFINELTTRSKDYYCKTFE